MSFSLIWPSGLTDHISTVDSAQLEQLDIDHANALDGLDGGAYTPTNPILVAGAGLGMNLPKTSGGVLIWPTFGNDTSAKRTFKKRFPCTPYARLFAGTLTSGSFIQGNIDTTSTAILDLPDGATITNIRMYVKIGSSHVSLPTLGPGLSVQRIQPGASATLSDVLNPGDSGDGKEITYALPGLVATYNAAGEVFVDYACSQNNVAARDHYYFLVLIQDETGGGAHTGNIYSGFEVTFSLTKLTPDGALQ